MEIRRLSDCTMNEAVQAWNRGFEGYYATVNTNSEDFIKRMVNEDLSPNLSFIAFSEGEPVGIMMNGIRIIDGKKMAWNGGTGIAPSFRGKGLSRKMMEHAIKIYEEENAAEARLEAISQNERAIKLYKKYGYEVVDDIVLLEKLISIDEIEELDESYSIEWILPEKISFLSLYDHSSPWQCQWQSMKTGEGLAIYDSKKNTVGYALFKRILNDVGQLERLVLYQLTLSSVDQVPEVLRNMLKETKAPVKVTAINFSTTNIATTYLLNHGFEKTVAQVHMKKVISQ